MNQQNTTNLLINKRHFGLEVLRILACFFVIIRHCPSSTISQGALQSVINFVGFNMSRLAVPCFLMITGYFMLPLKNINDGGYYKRKYSRILIPLLFWDILYVVFFSEPSFSAYLNDFINIPNAGHLWYLNELAILILLSAIISPFLKTVSKNILIVFLLLWGMTLIFNRNVFAEYPSYKFYFQPLNLIESLQPVYGYLGFLVLGYYVKRFGLSLLCKCLFLFLAFVVYFVEYFVINSPNPFSYLTIPNVLVTLVVFSFFEKFQSINNELYTFTVELSKLTFGIYLIHLMIITLLKENFQNFFNIGLWSSSIVIFIISTVLVYLISKIPFSKYFIG